MLKSPVSHLGKDEIRVFLLQDTRKGSWNHDSEKTFARSSQDRLKGGNHKEISRHFYWKTTTRNSQDRVMTSQHPPSLRHPQELLGQDRLTEDNLKLPTTYLIQAIKKRFYISIFYIYILKNTSDHAVNNENATKYFSKPVIQMQTN